jgi:Leucine-rich repeat (LRR) protein
MILTSNQFESSIPSFMLKAAAALHLSHNRFSNLDSLLCDQNNTFSSLGILDVSNNQLKGEIPDCWNNHKSLQYLDLSNNKLSGKIPLSIGALVNLKADYDFMSDNVSHNYHNNTTGSMYDYYISLIWKGVEDVFKNP